MRALALLVVAAMAGSATGASAAPLLTLNGVAIDGITDQRFENCTVLIDDQGNVHIEAKGYAVKGAEETRPADPSRGGPRTTPAAFEGQEPARNVTRRYFLVTEHTPPGTQYDLAIFINAQWIREVKASEPQVVMEVTKYLRPGRNKITLSATKRIAGERLAYGSDVQLRVVIGEGNVGGGHVMIDAPLVETARTAADVEDRTEEFVVVAR
jgi:hypothetical protein